MILQKESVIISYYMSFDIDRKLFLLIDINRLFAKLFVIHIDVLYFGIQQIRDENSIRWKNKATVNLKTERFNNIDSAVIISNVSKAVHNCERLWFRAFFQFYTALLTLLMMTAESMLSKRLILRFTETLFFLLKMFLICFSK